MASRTVRARLDQSSEHALSLLMGEGKNESEAVRAALVEAASRRMRRSALAEEAIKLAADPVDRAERKALLAEMESISPEWPS